MVAQSETVPEGPEQHWINPRTGDVVEEGTEGALLMTFSLPKPPPGDYETPDSEWLGEWLSRKIVEVEAAQAAQKLQAAQAALRLKAERRALNSYMERMRPVVDKQLEGTKRRSVPYTFGTFKLTKSSKVIVTDEFEALIWAEENCPQAVKTETSLLKSALPKGAEIPGIERSSGDTFSFAVPKAKKAKA